MNEGILVLRSCSWEGLKQKGSRQDQQEKQKKAEEGGMTDRAEADKGSPTLVWRTLYEVMGQGEAMEVSGREGSDQNIL